MVNGKWCTVDCAWCMVGGGVGGGGGGGYDNEADDDG